MFRGARRLWPPHHVAPSITTVLCPLPRRASSLVNPTSDTSALWHRAQEDDRASRASTDELISRAIPDVPFDILVPLVSFEFLERRLYGRISLNTALDILNFVQAEVHAIRSATDEVTATLKNCGRSLSDLMSLTPLIRPSPRGRKAVACLYEIAWNGGKGDSDPLAGYKLATLLRYTPELEPTRPGNAGLHLDRAASAAILAELMSRNNPLGPAGFAFLTELDYHDTPEGIRSTRDALRKIIVKRLTGAGQDGLGFAWRLLGRHHDEGILLPRSPSQAIMHYGKAKALGDPESCYLLGKAYERGIENVIAIHPRLALEHYQAGASGYGPCAYEAGLRYYLEPGCDLEEHVKRWSTNPSDETAEEYFTMAAEHGHPLSMVKLAEMAIALRGKDVPEMAMLTRLRRAKFMWSVAVRTQRPSEGPIVLSPESPLIHLDALLDSQEYVRDVRMGKMKEHMRLPKDIRADLPSSWGTKYGLEPKVGERESLAAKLAKLRSTNSGDNAVTEPSAETSSSNDTATPEAPGEDAASEAPQITKVALNVTLPAAPVNEVSGPPEDASLQEAPSPLSSRLLARLPPRT